jgi:hypothetical protein
MSTVQGLMASGVPAPTANAIQAMVLNGSGILPNTAVATAGTTQVGAAELTSGVNIMTTVNPTGNGGVRLPVQRGFEALGARMVISNPSFHPMLVYPEVGSSINGLAVNAPIYLRSGAFATFVRLSPTTWLATGEEISHARNEWFHLRREVTNNTTLTQIFQRAVNTQEGIIVSGYFTGALVGKLTAAAAVFGTFSGAASRAAAASLVAGTYSSDKFQSALATGSPNQSTTIASRSSLGTGLFSVDSTYADPALTPIVKAVVNGNNFEVQARSVATDTFRLDVSFMVKTFSGQ